MRRRRPPLRLLQPRWRAFRRPIFERPLGATIATPSLWLFPLLPARSQTRQPKANRIYFGISLAVTMRPGCRASSKSRHERAWLGRHGPGDAWPESALLRRRQRRGGGGSPRGPLGWGGRRRAGRQPRRRRQRRNSRFSRSMWRNKEKRQVCFSARGGDPSAAAEKRAPLFSS